MPDLPVSRVYLYASVTFCALTTWSKARQLLGVNPWLFSSNCWGHTFSLTSRFKQNRKGSNHGLVKGQTRRIFSDEGNGLHCEVLYYCWASSGLVLCSMSPALNSSSVIWHFERVITFTTFCPLSHDPRGVGPGFLVGAGWKPHYVTTLLQRIRRSQFLKRTK